MNNKLSDKWRWAAASALFAYSSFLSIFVGHSEVVACLLLATSAMLFAVAVKGSFRSFWRDFVGTPNEVPTSVMINYLVPPSLKIA